MTNHVDRWLAAYFERQLDPRRSRLVYLHLQDCPPCRARLAAREQMARSLRTMAQTGMSPSAEHVADWWQSIRALSATTISQPARPAWPLIMLSVLAALLPAALGVTSLIAWQPATTTLITITAPVETEPSERVLLAAIGAPRPRAWRAVETPATALPPQTSLPPAPAPLAPFRP